MGTMTRQERRTRRIPFDGKFYREDSFSRSDETDDAAFYARDRFVSHLDATALRTVETLIAELVVEPRPRILDLMAGWDSHLPERIKPAHVVGLGLNYNELSRNRAFNAFMIHDLNRDPVLPFPDATFDIVLNTVSVDYMTRPFEVFAEVGRILRPGGLFLVVFSNRMFRPKATKIWRESSEEERVILVEDFFNFSQSFETTQVFVARGRPRPPDDKYAHLDIPSDPIYAVYADKKSRNLRCRPQPKAAEHYGTSISREELQRRMTQVKATMRCPHCDTELSRWVVPSDPFIEWQADYMYICFNDQCPYFVRGWSVMYRDGSRGLSYRFMYDRERDSCLAVPVPSSRALKDGIVN